MKKFKVKDEPFDIITANPTTLQVNDVIVFCDSQAGMYIPKYGNITAMINILVGMVAPLFTNSDIPFLLVPVGVIIWAIHIFKEKKGEKNFIITKISGNTLTINAA